MMTGLEYSTYTDMTTIQIWSACQLSELIVCFNLLAGEDTIPTRTGSYNTKSRCSSGGNQAATATATGFPGATSYAS